jgi:ribonuclease HII
MAKFDTQALYYFDGRIETLRACRVVGLDEAGRGPLAGPVVAAAVMLDLGKPIQGVFDSKRIVPKKRETLYEQITVQAAAWALGEASVEEIEKLNILQASLLAMRRALDKIGLPWSLALVDGNQEMSGLAPGCQCTVIKGDATSASIAAASILAKVSRDRTMALYDSEFPDYGFGVHKGYGTALHIEKIRAHGPCRIHRKGFCEGFLEPNVLNLCVDSATNKHSKAIA